MAEDETSGENCLKKVSYVMKSLEAICLVICLAAVAYYLNNRDDDFSKRKNVEFFVDASLVVMTVVALFILILVFEIHKRAGVVFFIMALLMLIASSLLADFDKQCNNTGKSRCSQITAGVVFGFGATIALTVDSIVYCLRSIEDDDDSN